MSQGRFIRLLCHTNDHATMTAEAAPDFFGLRVSRLTRRVTLNSGSHTSHRIKFDPVAVSANQRL